MEEDSPIARFYREHVTTFILCDNDGTELGPVLACDVERIAYACNFHKRGCVKQVHKKRETNDASI